MDTSQDDKRDTHFGFRRVGETEKASMVADVFRSVAERYDVMNDLMSLGSHRRWKDFAVGQSGIRKGQRVLDVASGSGDLAWRFAQRVGSSGRVFVTDINSAMLQQGRTRLLDAGFVATISYAIADAERLAFTPGSFDCVSIGFGLRNVTRIDRALASMFEMLRPGGRIVVLEFSHPTSRALASIYDTFSFALIPRLGKAVTGDAGSYQYLVESIRRHPDQATLSNLMMEAGFEDIRYFNLSGGIVALHIGFRY